MLSAAASSASVCRPPPAMQRVEQFKRARSVTSTISFTPTLESHGDGVQPTQADRYLSVYQPNERHINREVVRVAELCIPYWVYRQNPTGLLPDNVTHDVLKTYRLLLYVFAYLAASASDPKRVLINENDLDADGDGGGRAKPRTREVPSERRVIVTMERVPFANTGKMAALRIRLTEQCPNPTDMGIDGALEELLKTNDANNKKAARGTLKVPFAPRGAAGSSKSPNLQTDPSSHLRVTTQMWRHLCATYGGPAYTAGFDATDPGVEGAPISSTSSPYNITKVFSLANSWAPLSRIGGVDPTFFTQESYVTAPSYNPLGKWYQWPDPACVSCLRPTSNHLQPSQLARLKMPWLQADIKQVQKQLEPWQKWHGPLATEEYFVRACVTTSVCEPPNDADTLTKRVVDDLSEIKFEFSDGTRPREEALARRAVQLKHNATASEILSPMGETSPALHALCGWGEQFIASNGNSLCINLPQSCHNLTRAQDFWVRAMVGQNETVLTVKVAHWRFLSMMLCGLTVYRRQPDNCHSLELGPPGAGKSRCMLNMIEMFVRDTVVDITDITDRAFLVPGRFWSDLIIVIQDAKSSLLDVNTNQGSGRQTVTSDRGNILKNILTSTHSQLMTLEMDPRRPVKIKSEICAVMFFAMNEPKKNFPAPILDRVIVNLWTQAAERDGASNISRTARERDPATHEAKQLVILVWHWMQYCVMQVLQRQAMGILLQHTLTPLMRFWERVRSLMHSKFGIKDLDNQRSFNRFAALAIVVNVCETVDLLLASPLSPFRGMPHSDDVWLAFEKHLVVTVRQAVFAVGLVACQWQDDLRTQVISTMRRLWFPNSAEQLRQNREVGVMLEVPMPVEEIDAWTASDLKRREPTPPEGQWAKKTGQQQPQQQESSEMRAYNEQKVEYDACRDRCLKWMYAVHHLPTPITQGGGGRYRNQEADQDRQLKKMADEILQAMPNPPMRDELVAILQSLTQELVTEERRVQSEDGSMDLMQKRRQCAALVIEETRISMCVGLLERGSVAGALETCVQQAAQELYEIGGTEPSCTYLYGQVDPAVPYAWKTFTVTKDRMDDPTQPREPIRIQNASYFSKPMRDITLAGLSMLDPVGTTRAGKQSDLFPSSTPWIVVTRDVDQSGFEERMAAMRITDAVAERQISIWPHVNEKRLGETDRGQHSFPTCFTETNFVKYRADWEVKFDLDPSAFSSACHDAESNKTRNRTYDDDFPDLPMFIRDAEAEAALHRPMRFADDDEKKEVRRPRKRQRQHEPGTEQSAIDMDIDLERSMQAYL